MKKIYSTEKGDKMKIKSKRLTPEVNRADINMSQLERNINILRSLLKPGVRFMAIVKGDAYGHGLVPMALEAQRCKCDMIGVVRVTEGLELRKGGIDIPILILAPIMPEQAECIVEQNITPIVDKEESIIAIEKSAVERKKVATIHVKINTGLNRYGIEPENALDFIRMIHEKYSHIRVEGIYTHFRDAEANESYTFLQLRRFNEVLSQLEKENLRPQIAHAGASGGILLYPESHYDMVRCGIILYGLEHKEGEKMLPEGVKPLMTIKSYILKIKEIKTGESGGYGRQFIAKRESLVAVIGIGYGDGISRGWKEVLIAGQRVPVVNYFMDGILIDITDLKSKVKEYDEVVVIGSQGNENISWEEACNPIQCAVDEQLQRITERVPKNYFYEE